MVANGQKMPEMQTKHVQVGPNRNGSELNELKKE